MFLCHKLDNNFVGSREVIVFVSLTPVLYGIFYGAVHTPTEYDDTGLDGATIIKCKVIKYIYLSCSELFCCVHQYGVSGQDTEMGL